MIAVTIVMRKLAVIAPISGAARAFPSLVLILCSLFASTAALAQDWFAYFPTASGEHWVYQTRNIDYPSNAQTVETGCVVSAGTGNASVSRFVRCSPAGVFYDEVVSTPATGHAWNAIFGNICVDENGEPYACVATLAPAVRFLPAIGIGASLNQSVQVTAGNNGVAYNTTTTILSTEGVGTPAAYFPDAVKVRIVFESVQGIPFPLPTTPPQLMYLFTRATHTIWFARDVGIVKWQIRSETSGEIEGVRSPWVATSDEETVLLYSSLVDNANCKEDPCDGQGAGSVNVGFGNHFEFATDYASGADAVPSLVRIYNSRNTTASDCHPSQWSGAGVHRERRGLATRRCRRERPPRSRVIERRHPDGMAIPGS
jgi:hypothetical protein